MKSNYFRWLLLSVALYFGSSSCAYANMQSFEACAKQFVNNNAARLECFDQAVAKNVSVSVIIDEKPAIEAVNQSAVNQTEPGRDELIDVRERQREERRAYSYLTKVWDLKNRPHNDPSTLDRLQLHRQGYLIARKTSNVNNLPFSPAAGHSSSIGYGMDSLETRYQLSFKTDILTVKNLDLQDLQTFRLWAAYTQQSNWQVFNTRNSSPFRETNYEPELIGTFATGRDSGWKLFNLGLVHQSNGKSVPESRSWNRVYLQGGWERNNISVLTRGWWRIPENVLKDDNPDITHYIGRADLVARWEPDSKSQAISILLRNNLNLNQNLGLVQLDWALPVPLGNAARLHAQFSTGYGESLIDYNHRQTTFGLGFSFREW